MTNDERDFQEERYNAELCPLCDYSPCIGGSGKGSCEPDSIKEPFNPGQALERHYALAAEQDGLAKEAKAKGWTFLARSYRASAAGHRAAYTRIARTLDHRGGEGAIMTTTYRPCERTEPGHPWPCTLPAGHLDPWHLVADPNTGDELDSWRS